MADIRDNNNSITEDDVNFHLKSSLNERIANYENILVQSKYTLYQCITMFTAMIRYLTAKCNLNLSNCARQWWFFYKWFRIILEGVIYDGLCGHHALFKLFWIFSNDAK